MLEKEAVLYSIEKKSKLSDGNCKKGYKGKNSFWLGAVTIMAPFYCQHFASCLPLSLFIGLSIDSEETVMDKKGRRDREDTCQRAGARLSAAAK